MVILQELVSDFQVGHSVYHADLEENPITYGLCGFCDEPMLLSSISRCEDHCSICCCENSPPEADYPEI